MSLVGIGDTTINEYLNSECDENYFLVDGAKVPLPMTDYDSEAKPRNWWNCSVPSICTRNQHFNTRILRIARVFGSDRGLPGSIAVLMGALRRTI